MARKGIVRRIYRRAGRRMGKTTIPVMGVLTGVTLATSVAASSAGQPSAGDTPLAWALKGNLNNALVKTQYNLSKASTYVPVVVPLIVWGVGRALLGKVKLSRKISLF